MSTRLRIVSIVAAAGLLAGAAAPVLAADSETVEVTVTAAAPCITVGPESIDYGNLTFGGNGLAAISYQNCGGLPEIVYGRATDAVGQTAAWNLGDSRTVCSSAPVNEFALRLVLDPGEPREYFDFLLAEVDAVTDASLAADAFGRYVELYLFMPCPGSDGANEQMSMQVTFTATY